MYIRTFRAANLQDALEQIRVQMGPDASVLHTRQKRDGLWGWLGRTYVEVTAGAKNELTDRLHETASATVHMTRGRIDGDGTWSHDDPGHDGAGQGGYESSTYPIRPMGASAHSTTIAGSTNHSAGNQAAVGQGMSRIDPMTLSNRDTDSSSDFVRDELMAAGVAGSVADRWIRSAESFAAATAASGQPGGLDWMEHLRSAVMRELRIGSPIRTQPGDRRVVALVGPTGVGKTTTVAKLAAGFRLQARRRVGLLTIDTFRIAAVQQLRAYADIMDLPMQVVEHGHEMTAALEKLGDVDLVLIDTAGRSPRSDARVEQLVEMLRPAQPDETHLVISASSSASSISQTIEGFAPVSPTSAILTKLDETPHLAGPLASVIEGGVPLSYTTNGQQVPDDIAVADGGTLVTRLMAPGGLLPTDASEPYVAPVQPAA